MGEFTQASQSAPDIAGVENWRGLRVGQQWCRLTRVHREWPQGRVYVTDLIRRGDAYVVKFLDNALDEGKNRLELSLSSFLKEFVQQ